MAFVTLRSDQKNSYSAAIDWSGDDAIFGADNNNNVTTGTEKGGLQGYAGADYIDGGGGNDDLYGYYNPNNPNATPAVPDGGDTLIGGAGNDRLFGQDGNDMLYPGSGSNHVDGGSGTEDTVNFGDLNVAVTANLAAGTATHGGDLDTLIGIEWIRGSLHSDTFTGDGGDNRIQGWGGDDVLAGGGGTDTALFGGAREHYAVTVESGGALRIRDDRTHEQIVADTGAHSTPTSDGTDTLTGFELFRFRDGTYSLAQLLKNVPTNGDDVLTGTEGPDEIDGLGGDDEIQGLGGDDVLFGGSGTDTIIGGAGNDRLDGGADADYMDGGSGDDTYYVDHRNDVVFEDGGGLANDPNDQVRSRVTWDLRNSGDVEVLWLIEGSGPINGTGNALANRITGNSAANQLYGRGANDSLFGLGGNDILDGGAGADRMEGGAGDDTYIVDNSGDEVVETAGGGSNDVVKSFITHTLAANVEGLSLIAPTGPIDGTGNGLDNWITGTPGANKVYGLGGNDTLKTGPGDDFLDGGTGADHMEGGLGDDIYIVDDAGDVVVDGATENKGYDTVHAWIGYTLPTNVERLELQGTDPISGKGNDGANAIVGNDAANELHGFGGADDLVGNGGNDRLDGGTGADRMEGGAGNDTYVVDDDGDTVIEIPGGGNDTVRASVSFTLGAEVEKLVLTGGAVQGTGNAGANRIVGNALDNAIRGAAGDDQLDGRAGDDTLVGGGGNDTLRGGLGRDVMKGMSGEDRFVFVTADSGVGAERDVIRDFTHGIDLIDLRKVDGNLDLAGNQRLTFIGADAFSGEAGELRVFRKVVAADLDGDMRADFEIRLFGVDTIDRHDFVL